MISSRGRYAVKFMIDLAEHDNGSYIPLKDVAARQGISKKYLEIIVRDLVKNGFIIGASGKGGGYKLTRRPDEYPVGEIIEALEGPFATVVCLADKGYECPKQAECKPLPMWEEFDRLTHNYFYSKKISDLL